MRSGNPALNADTFSGFGGNLTRSSGQMTLIGTVHKSFLMLGCVMLAAGWSWFQTMDPAAATMLPLYLWGGAIGGFIMAMVTIFKKEWCPVTAPIYALLEGLFLGVISAQFEAMYANIVVQAILITFGVLFSLLTVYQLGIIRATENFKLGVMAATGGIAIVYLINFVLSFFGHSVPFLHDTGPIGIGISVFICIIAALNLVLDFDFIEQGSEQGAPKYMEWYGAFGLIVTLVWLYLEILRLLAKLRER